MPLSNLFDDDKDQLLSEKELAEKLKNSVRTLQRLHLARKGPPRTTIGGRVYYRTSSVAVWLLNRETKPPARYKAGRTK